MKVLFICSRNDQRSKVAEAYFSRKYPKHDFKSAGTNYTKCKKLGTNKLTDDLLLWAEKIYVMQEHHHNMIKKYGSVQCNEKITVLHIPDNIYKDENDLIDQLKNKVVLS